MVLHCIISFELRSVFDDIYILCHLYKLTKYYLIPWKGVIANEYLFN